MHKGWSFEIIIDHKAGEVSLFQFVGEGDVRCGRCNRCSRFGWFEFYNAFICVGFIFHFFTICVRRVTMMELIVFIMCMRRYKYTCISEVGGVSPTGKLFRFVSFARARGLVA